MTGAREQERRHVELFTPAEKALLSRYVTNVTGDVYAIVNVPEEVVAVIFAYVSRSPASFKRNLLRLMQSGDVELPVGPSLFQKAGEKAAEFHRRWVIGYGHSSVAEHAVVHIGVENVSRLASAVLELANPFLSFTEYSQRYQKPVRGRYYVPCELAGDLLAAYRRTMDFLYDRYEELYHGLVAYLESGTARLPGETDNARAARLDKKAFEDARYALPLAMFTSLGATGNGRAWRDALQILYASPYAEVRAMANRIEEEAGQVLPTLLRHSTPTAYMEKMEKERHRLAQPPARSGTEPGRTVPGRAERSAASGAGGNGGGSSDNNHGPQAILLDYTGYGAADPEEVAVRRIAEALGATRPGEAISAELYALVDAAIGEITTHDALPEACRWVRYEAYCCLSEAAWHQLLRHRRGMTFQWNAPGIAYGFTIPGSIKAAGLEQCLREAVSAAEELYVYLCGAGFPEAAAYTVLNAHHRRIRTEFDLRQFYHLANLRLAPEAQWDIKELVRQLYQQIMAVHPNLCRRASRR